MSIQSEQLRKEHIESFARLSLSERFTWVFRHGQFLADFMDSEAQRIKKKDETKWKKILWEYRFGAKSSESLIR